MSTTSPSTAPAPSPPTNDPDAPAPRLNLSVTQVVASALAAVTATVSASYLGIAGTVIGAAVASVLTVIGNAVYSLSIRRTGERVRTVVPAAARLPRVPAPPAPVPSRAVLPRGLRGRWGVLAAACVGVFAAVLVLVTSVELIAGRPLTDLVRGESGSGTTIFHNVAQPVRTRPVHTPTITITPKVVTQTPTVTVTGDPVTATAKPTTTTSPAATSSSAPSSPAPSSSQPSTQSASTTP